MISSEARAPTTASTTKIEEIRENGLSPAQVKREKEISSRLKKDLLRKRRAAEEWAAAAATKVGNQTENVANKKTNGGGGKKQRNGQQNKKSASSFFTPEKFHNMMSVRQRLPAYQLEHEVVQTILRNQITVIAGTYFPIVFFPGCTIYWNGNLMSYIIISRCQSSIMLILVFIHIFIRCNGVREDYPSASACTG